MNRSSVRIVKLQTLKRKIEEMKPGEQLFVYSEHNFQTHAILQPSSRKTAPKFNCSHCEQTVLQSISDNRRINACNCLTAVFSAPYGELSELDWTLWGGNQNFSEPSTQLIQIDECDQDHQGALQYAQGAPINRSRTNKNNCWCPFCQFSDQPADPFAHAWNRHPYSLSAGTARLPADALICTYNLCTVCSGVPESRNPFVLAKFFQTIKLNLLRRYPALLQGKISPTERTALPPDPKTDDLPPVPKLDPPFISKTGHFFRHNWTFPYNSLTSKDKPMPLTNGRKHFPKNRSRRPRGWDGR